MDGERTKPQGDRIDVRVGEPVLHDPTYSRPAGRAHLPAGA